MKKSAKQFDFKASWTALICLFTFGISLLPAVTLINENMQSWTAYTSYGNYTQAIPAGTVAMTSCMVSPGAAATGTCSIGRLQMQASNGIVLFPELPSIGQVEFHFAAGSTGRSVKLQKLNGTTWEDITTFTGISATGATYAFEVNLAEPTSIRLATPSHALYVHDIIVTDYQNVEFPIVTTTAVSNITYSTAISGGNVENTGTSALTERGVCWSRLINPVATDSLTSDGTGIGTYTSTITDLQPDTDYHVRAYASNASGTSYGEDILFRTSNLGIPSTQAVNFVFYPGNSSVEATWTPGNGAKRIIKLNTANNFTNPVNGVAYTASNVYSGSGEQVVYNGATQIIEGEAINAVSVTGLTPNTTYWFRAYDYNGDGTATQYNTNTATNNPRSVTTLNSIISGYYEGIAGTGTTLKTNLSNLIRTTHLTHFSYDAVWTQLQFTDEDSTNTNNVIEEYTGWSVPKSYNGGGTSQWNREHTWSKSHGDFGETAPAGTDLHHLRPADSTVNSAKGNKDFDDGGTAVVDSSPYTGYNGTTGCYTDTDSWEPRVVEKGDVARMILYMAVRYEGADTSYNLEMQDATPTSGPYYGKLSTLLQWHVQDPPDSWERRRNNRIQERQGNRNPFIDHPEFVNQIWAPVTTYPTLMDSITFIANWTAAVNAQSYVLDVAYDNSFTNFLTGFDHLNVGNTTTRTVTVPASNTTYYYRLRAFFTAGYSMYSNVSAASLTSAPVVYTAFDTNWSWNEQIGYFVDATWTAQSESSLQGFMLYRSQTNNLANALNVTLQMIPATNTGTPQNYSYRDGGLAEFTMYYYWIQNLNLDGGNQFYGPDSIFVGEVANEDYTLVKPVITISRIYPNPFRQNTAIDFVMQKAEAIELKVYNLKGQCVQTLYSGYKAAGLQTLAWKGRDDHGTACTPGVYLIRLNSGSTSVHKKVVLF
jgi:endonuclease I